MTVHPKSQTPNNTSESSGASFTLLRLFLIWLRIGCTSFGGGAITQYLIQENFIYKYKWITAAEFANIIGMSQVAPGINLFAYTILIGKKLAGWVGICLSLLGLVLPSVAITIGITAVYSVIRESPPVQNSLRTIFAAIFGISLATNCRNVRPIFQNGRKRGTLVYGVIVGIIIGSALISTFLKLPVVIVYILGGLCGAWVYWYAAKKERGV